MQFYVSQVGMQEIQKIGRIFRYIKLARVINDYASDA